MRRSSGGGAVCAGAATIAEWWASAFSVCEVCVKELQGRVLGFWRWRGSFRFP